MNKNEFYTLVQIAKKIHFGNYTYLEFKSQTIYTHNTALFPVQTLQRIFTHTRYWTCIHLLSDPTCTGCHSPVCSKNPGILDNIKWKNNISWANHCCGPIENQTLWCARFLGGHCTMLTCMGTMALAQFLTTTIHKKYTVLAILLLWVELLELTAKYSWGS
jgi:hypothetical protein